MSSDDESSTLERRLASKLVDKLNVQNEQPVEAPEVEPEVVIEEAIVNPFTEKHQRSLIQAKVDLILKVGYFFRCMLMNICLLICQFAKTYFRAQFTRTCWKQKQQQWHIKLHLIKQLQLKPKRKQLNELIK